MRGERRVSGERLVVFMGGLLLAAALCAPVASWAATGGEAGFDEAALGRLEEELGRIVGVSEVPGAAVALVARDGTAWSRGFGTADLATGRPVTEETLFRTNSVSKSLVALAVLRLVEERRIALDDRLREVAPEIAFENRWEETHPVRVVHLLEHTTGFDDLHLREYAFGPDDWTLREALALNPAPRVARWPPGTRMAYDNGAYAVAAHLVETLSGERFEAYVDREVLLPLGMTSSGFGLERIDRERLTDHHLDGPAVEPAEPYPLLVRPAGGFVSSADDLAKLVRGLLRGGEPVVSAAAVDRMRRPRTTDAARAGLAIGYGLGSYAAPGAEGRIWHGHAGGTPSAFARYAYQPDLGVGYAVLMNGSDGDARDRLEAAIQRFLVAGRPAPEPAPAVEAAPDQAAYGGLYRQSTASWQLTAGVERLFDVQRVSVAEGALTLSPLLGGPPRTLLLAGGDLFRTGEWSEPSMVFLRSGGGDAATGLRTWDPENLRAGNYQRVSAPGAYLPLAIFLLSLLLAVSALLVAPVHGVAALLRRTGPGGPPAVPRRVHALPLLAVVSLVAAAVALGIGVSGEDGLLALGRPSVPAVAYWLLTWTFALLSAAALIVTARELRRPPPGIAARLALGHSFLAALACAALVLYLADWGWLGLRTWAY